VLHAASDLKTPVTHHPAAVLDANLMTTMRLLEACREHGVTKFAFISTCAVYGENVDTSEDAPCCPVTINGITKLLNERIVQAFCAESGIDCQIYRVFNMYGGNDRFSILRLKIESSSVMEAAYSRADIARLTSTIGNQRFVDVMDFVQDAFAG
jgi:nucleoside-diphosphate-sugar epimerase